MLRHIVLIALSDETGENERRAIREGLEALPEVIPEIEEYSIRFDIGMSEGNASFVITGDFADVSAYRTYAEHPVHLDVISQKIAPFVKSRSAVQVEVV